MLTKKEGITLIALVVTIIVLLILAGVTLTLVAGENGILKRATNAVDVNEKASAQEEANLLIADFATQYYEGKYVNHKADFENVDDYIKAELRTEKETEGGYKVKYDEETEKIKVSNHKLISSGTIINGKVDWEKDNSNDTDKEPEEDDTEPDFSENLVLLEHFDENIGMLINTNKITSEEKKVGNSSLSLNANWTDDVDSITKQFEFSGDFTVEYWAKIASANLNSQWAPHLSVAANNGIYLGLNNGKYIVRGWYITNYLEIDPPPMDEWVHIAVVRKNENLMVFYNGVLQGSVKNTIQFANGTLCFGHDATVGYSVNSYMDELKISPNVAKYESNFDVNNSRTEPNDIIYHFENDDKLSYSNAMQSATEKKFGNSSYYFNNAYMQYKEPVEFSGDFTVDYWLKSSSENLKAVWWTHFSAWIRNGLCLGFNNGKFIVRGWDGGDNHLEIDPPPMNEWVHIAVTRKDSTLYVFYNGILQKQIQDTTHFTKGNLNIGWDGVFSLPVDTYFDELRVLNGYCAWTENFEVPTRAYK